VWQVGLIALAMAVLPIYGWVLQPLTYMWGQPRFTALPEWEAFIAEATGLHVRVFVINKNFYNAFATGALPFARVILVGRPLLESLPEDELKAIMLHEAGHVAHHDLPRLCLLSMLIGSASAALFCWVQLWMDRWQVGAYWVGIYGALQYAIGYGLITGLITKRMEYRADTFAAERVGAGTYAAMLTHLDQLTDGLLKRGNMTHPTLAQRLRHVAPVTQPAAQAA
jgi:Zn-dependent protease with chaperone function